MTKEVSHQGHNVHEEQKGSFRQNAQNDQNFEGPDSEAILSILLILSEVDFQPIGLFSDRMHTILRMGISEASDKRHFVHFVNSVRNRNLPSLAADTAASTFIG